MPQHCDCVLEFGSDTSVLDARKPDIRYLIIVHVFYMFDFSYFDTWIESHQAGFPIMIDRSSSAKHELRVDVLLSLDLVMAWASQITVFSFPSSTDIVGTILMK
jgi:hypothetical protein